MTNSEAIAVLMEQKRYVHENSVPDQALDMGIKALKNERKKGKWEISPTISVHDVCGILSWGNRIKCSNCGFVHTAVEGHYNQYNYCPECGADMREEKTDAEIH